MVAIGTNMKIITGASSRILSFHSDIRKTAVVVPQVFVLVVILPH